MHLLVEAQREDFAAVLAAARRGDETAFGHLYRWFNPRLIRYLRQQLPWEADDLAAETWLSVARSLDRFGGGVDDFRAWLFTIARRRIVDHRRRAGRRPPTVHLDLALAAPLGGEVDAQVLATLTAQEAVDALVRDLPPAQAEVVLLRVLADLSIEEVARITGRTSGSVRVLQHRALRRLAREWPAPGEPAFPAAPPSLPRTSLP